MPRFQDNYAFDLLMLLALAVGFRVLAYICVYLKARR